MEVAHMLQRMRLRTIAPVLALVALSLIALSLIALALVALPARTAAAAPAASGASCSAQPIPGQHIYDCAGILTPGEIASLETHAAAVERAGAPTVVYLQAKDATPDETVQDAANLMQRWNIESKPGAKDGFVMLLNLQPGNLRHGAVGLYAGQKHFQSDLSQSELQRIVSDVMTPLLKNGDTAGGIAAGLDAVYDDLHPSPARQTARAIGTVPFNSVSLLFAGIVALLFARNRRPRGWQRQPFAMPTTTPPNDLRPAMVGALMQGKTTDGQMEATILDFAHRGLLTMEPAGTSEMLIRLTGDGHDLDGYEAQVWQALSGLADAEGVVWPGDMAQLRARWTAARGELRSDLLTRGWYDTQIAARRRPLIIAGIVGIAAVAVSVIIAIIAREGWALIGGAIFLTVGIGAFVLAATLSNTSAAGEAEVAPWRGYVQGLQHPSLTASRELDYDAVIPYAVALGENGIVTMVLDEAKAHGYSPRWFRSTPEDMRTGRMIAFYPYWIGWHTSMYPPQTSSGGGGGFSGGGAAAGGGGAGGSF
jgi:uncharacterized membrane protein YgcG